MDSKVLSMIGSRLLYASVQSMVVRILSMPQYSVMIGSNLLYGPSTQYDRFESSLCLSTQYGGSNPLYASVLSMIGSNPFYTSVLSMIGSNPLYACLFLSGRVPCASN